MTPLRRPRTTGRLAGLLAALLVACVPAGEQSTPTVEPAPDVAGDPGSGALRLLATLAVRDRGPRTGYAREAFGPAWADVDRNGCDTRNDILRRDLIDVRVEPGTRDCVIVSGRLADPYTGATIVFEKGRATAIDIDHVVALGDAWATGASDWEPRKRAALANDPLNLLAVDASANRAKRDADAASWLPPNAAARCDYVARQIAVKAKYALWVSADERDAMQRVLGACPGHPAPTGDAPILAPAGDHAPRHEDAPVATHTRREDAPVATHAPRREPAKPTSGADPNYGTCKQAKAHGAGPYRRDRDPEYHYYRDADGDGVVCE